MNRRVGCLILALLFALLFIFWGMMCRLTLPISPEAPHNASSHSTHVAIPAKAGIQTLPPTERLQIAEALDSRFRGNDGRVRGNDEKSWGMTGNGLELHGVPDVVDVEQLAAAVQVHAHQVYAPRRF